MGHDVLLRSLEEGLRNGRIAPQVAAYIAAEVLGVEARATGYDDTIRLEDSADLDAPQRRTSRAR